MYYMDKNASDSPPFPKWFMTLVSMYGLGFQLLFWDIGNLVFGIISISITKLHVKSIQEAGELTEYPKFKVLN